MKEVIFEITAFEQMEGGSMIPISGQLLKKKEVLCGGLLFPEIRKKMTLLNDLAKHCFAKPILF